MIPEDEKEEQKQEAPTIEKPLESEAVNEKPSETKWIQGDVTPLPGWDTLKKLNQKEGEEGTLEKIIPTRPGGAFDKYR